MIILRKKNIKRKSLFIVVLLFVVLLMMIKLNSLFEHKKVYEIKDIPSQSLETYFSIEQKWGIKWYYLAAMDDIEGTIGQVHRIEQYHEILSIYNRNQKNIKKSFIEYKDKDYLDEILKSIEKFENIDVIYRDKNFPIPPQIAYTYENGWGDERTYGGERKHEGIDILAKKGVPILSVGEGKVQKIGWNELGGWRIGIRGRDGIYYYYAHLDCYENDMTEGKEVSKGDIIGYVGNTGYGPEGTEGKFIDHLHFGMYQNNQAINPYPFLKAWELSQDN